MKVAIIAIVGGSGSGKTWLARQLQRRLGARAGRLSLDDFYRDRSHLPAGVRARINFDHPRAIDWPHFRQCLKKIKTCQAVALPRYDFVTHARRATPRRWQPKPVVLVDGLWLLRRPELRRLYTVSVFLDCPAKLQLARRLARDQRERGRSPASVRYQFRTQVAPMDKQFVAPQKRWAKWKFGPAEMATAVMVLYQQERPAAQAPNRPAGQLNKRPANRHPAAR